MRLPLLALSALLVACSTGNSILSGPTDAGADAPATDVTTADLPITDLPAADTAATDAPVTVDASTTTVIGPAGGTVTFTLSPGGDVVTLTVPPGALSSPTPITIMPFAGPTPAGYTAATRLYQFGPAGLTFATPAQVSLQPGASMNLSHMDILWAPSATGTFTSLGAVAGANLVTANVGHFSVGFAGRWDADGGGPACEPGYERCADRCSDLSFDEANCGVCGTSCAVGEVCFNAVCRPTTCNDRFADCNSNPADGCETDLTRDPAHCGTCANNCDGGTCAKGICSQ